MADFRLIDANALKAKLYSLLKIEEAPPMFIEGLETALAVADVAPTIDAAPVAHGRWIRFVVDRRHQIEGDECSACGFVYGGLGIEYFRYCPNCGAKMDGGAEG